MSAFTTLNEWDSGTIVEKVKSDGIVVLNRFFNAQQLDILNAEFDALFEAPAEGVHTHHRAEYLDAKMVDPRKLDAGKFPVLAGLADDQVLRRAAEDYFRKPIIYPHKIFATWSWGTEDPVPTLPFVAHTDRFHMLKYMIYLHDVTAANGAMAAAPGKHIELAPQRLAWLQSGKPYEKRPNIIPQYDNALVPIEAEAGSILVFDTDVPHKAGKAVPGQERKALRIDIVCPSYAGTTGKRGILRRLFGSAPVTD